MAGNVEFFLGNILLLWLLMFCYFLSAAPNPTSSDIKSLLPCTQDCEALAHRFLTEKYETEASAWATRCILADWNYSTDLGNETARQESEKTDQLQAVWEKSEHKDYISQFPWKQFTNASIKRQFRFISDMGIAGLNESDLAQYTTIMATMKKIYGTAKVCPYKKQACDIKSEGLELNPDIENVMSGSSDYNELAYMWTAWRNASGKLMRELYNSFLNLANTAAVLDGYSNAGDFLLRKYESETFREEMEVLWNEVRPLYEELHAYVRYRLGQVYPQVKTTSPIPAHLLGNMWSQTWENVYKYVVPFPNASSFDATQELIKRFPSTKSGVREMFKVANEFFLSLGLEDMSEAYGDEALIIKPSDGRVVDCHASAWDFSTGKDFRIKMCVNVNETDFVVIHHELGHIQYYKQYRNLSYAFREGANPGFQEAIGDVVALSVSSPSHMRLLGYVNSSVEMSKEAELNFLMSKGLEKIAFLPFGYLIDKYRWGLFDGSVPRDEMTKHWLRLRNSLQGIVPPVTRTETDFDAGSKFHVPQNTPYIAYFVSYILQFQIHKELCGTAGHKGPLYTCDIYGNKEAGLKFKNLMAAGFTRNWKEVLGELTEGRMTKLSAEPIKEYFKPLTEYLKGQRSTFNYPVGWDEDAYLKLYNQS